MDRSTSRSINIFIISSRRVVQTDLSDIRRDEYFYKRIVGASFGSRDALDRRVVVRPVNRSIRPRPWVFK